MRLNPVLAEMASYPFVRLTEAKRAAVGARHRRHRLRDRRAARAHAGLHPARAGAGARGRADLDLPAERGASRAARGDRRLGGAPLRRRARPRDRDRPDPGLQGGDLPPRAGRRRPRAARRRDHAGLSRARPRRAVRRRGGRRGAARPRARLAARPRRGRLGRRRAAVAELPQQPDGGDGARRSSTSAPPRSPAATTSSSPPTRPTPSCGSRATPPVSALQAGRPHQRARLQHALQALVDAGLPLGLRGRRPRDRRRAQALPPERRRRAADLHPARRRRGVGRRGARDAVRERYRAKRDALLPALLGAGLERSGGDASFFLWLRVPGARTPRPSRCACSTSAGSRSPRARTSARAAPATCGSRSCPRPRTAAARPSA